MKKKGRGRPFARRKGRTMKYTSAEILSVGTELLLGDIVNTDAAYLARRLAQLGIPLYRQSVVGDNEARLREAIGAAFSRADLLILTGGLGPTCDDITKETVARYFGLPLVRDEASEQAMRAYFAGRAYTANNEKQALVPAGATVFPNGCGTAPGIAVEAEGKTAILLPGPPSELIPMFEESVAPYLARCTDGVMYSLNLHLAGIGESAAEARLRDIMDASQNPTVAPYAGEHEVRIRITARAETEEECRALCRRKADEVLARGMGAYLYAETDNPTDASDAPAAALLDALRERGETFAAAESCTGGMIAERITARPGASEVFLGSIVSYACSVKEAALGVRQETLSRLGAVSEQTAGEMAMGAARLCGASVVVSVTGVAGPGGGTKETPVGTVCFGVWAHGTLRVSTEHFNPHGTRERIRRQASSHAMRLALAALREGDA